MARISIDGKLCQFSTKQSILPENRNIAGKFIHKAHLVNMSGQSYRAKETQNMRKMYWGNKRITSPFEPTRPQCPMLSGQAVYR